MRTGIVMTARPGAERFAARAEELGFDRFWVYDSPMVNGDRAKPFVVRTFTGLARPRRRAR